MIHNTPKGILEIISLLHTKEISYILFKCEHIIEGENKNVDILCETVRDFSKASRILEQNGFLLYMDESVEKYKRMYVKVNNNILTAIHLHQEIAWHGIKAIDKRSVFKRKQVFSNQKIIPSPEDSLIIHVAHLVFENYNYRNNFPIKLYLKKELDWGYIKKKVDECGWKKAFRYVISCTRNETTPEFYSLLKLTKKKILSHSPYLIWKIIKNIGRRLSIKRKGSLIVLVGVNGAGKTTLTKEILNEYKQISKFFNGQNGYYFGWEPFLPTTKLLSNMLKKKNKKTFNSDSSKKISLIGKLFQEVLFTYNFTEYLARYLFHIFPTLRNNGLVVVDRYYYDQLAQYNYGPKSLMLRLLLPIFPKPDYLYVLDTDIKTLQNRDKNIDVYSKNAKRDNQREVHTTNDLSSQKERYNYIAQKFNGKIINTESDVKVITKMILNDTWKKLVPKTEDDI
jgi:thymidylate kinase